MNKNRVLAIATILIGSLFVFSSCDQSTSTELDDTFNVIKEVSAIEGAQNATMNLSNNSSNGSAFVVNFSNIEPNNLINNGQKEAWCIEWGVPVNNGNQEGVKLYSTRGQDGWKELNYFLSIKDQLKKQDPDLTWKEVQVVIWSLVQYKPFDVDDIPTYQNFDKQFYDNGEYRFNVQKVKNIVSQVKSNMSSNKLKEVSTFGVYAVVVENNGQTVIVEGEETFWAFGTAYCFRGDKGNQWGWAYAFENTDGNSESTPLVAGAGQSTCPDETVEAAGGTIVGEVTIERDGDNLTITLTVLPNSDYVIDVVHIDVDSDLEVLKTRMINNGGNVAPGQFPIAWSDDGNGEVATSVEFSVSLSENSLPTSGNLYFAIHGVSGVVSE